MRDSQQKENTTSTPFSPEKFSRLLNAPLAKLVGGLELCQAKEGKLPVRFADQTDRTYQDLLAWITAGARALKAQPRMDMPGAVAASYEQDFGHLSHGGGR